MALLEAKGLRVEYPGFVLGPLDLAVQPGERVAVLGESGSGKTTLLRALARLDAPRAAVSGQILLAGQDIGAMRETQLRALRMEQFALCFQNAAQWMNPTSTVYAQLCEVLARRYPRAAWPARARALLEEAGLPDGTLDKTPGQLSGGMAQKCMLAMAAALRPPLLLLDEPTSALDEDAREDFLRFVDKLHAQGIATVTVTHDVTVARRAADRTLVLYGGQLVEEGGTQQLLESPRHPYTRGLLASFPELYPLRDLWGIRPAKEPEGKGCVFCARCTQSVPACAERQPPLVKMQDGRKLACHRGGVVCRMRLRGIHKALGGQPVLRDAALELYAGETVALTGPAGSGKSTLCAVAAGFLAPDAGTIEFEGESGRMDRPGGMQLVAQDSAAAVNPHFTVLRAAAEPGLLAGLYHGEQEAREAVCRALEMVGLPAGEAFLQRRAGELSGGQLQRLALARALTMQPSVLIADEPTAMLDASSRANVLRMLKGVQNAAGCAMLVVTHDRAAAEKIADRVLAMQNGAPV